MFDSKDRPISDLIGKTLTEVTVNDHQDEILFVADDGTTFKMFHDQDCCESVSVEDLAGDIADLVGSPILMAEEASAQEDPPGHESEYRESWTWTFYKIATIKGSVTIRWLGESNGYYSEGVDFVETTDTKP